jgi:hypothetical protein
VSRQGIEPSTCGTQIGRFAATDGCFSLRVATPRYTRNTQLLSASSKFQCSFCRWDQCGYHYNPPRSLCRFREIGVGAPVGNYIFRHVYSFQNCFGLSMQQDRGVVTAGQGGLVPTLVSHLHLVSWITMSAVPSISPELASLGQAR